MMIINPYLFATAGGAGLVKWNGSNKGANIVLSNGDMKATYGAGGAGGGESVISTTSISSGKRYFEVRIDNASASNGILVGISVAANPTSYISQVVAGYGYYQTGHKYRDGIGFAYGNTFTTADVIGVAVDFTGGKIWFSKNGVWQASGDPGAGTGEAFNTVSGAHYAAASEFFNTDAVTARFTAASQSYVVPSGFSAWE